MRATVKRAFDLLAALVLTIVLSPLIAVLSLLIFLQDFRSPFFIAGRVGRGRRPFRMCKFRSMVVNASKTGVMSTAGDDKRITPIGAFVRRFKLDEVPQLFNIITGSMSFVGPRPNVESEVKLYSEVEGGLLRVRPGITDFASIVFSDEGDILTGSDDPDRDYNLMIRPWKSRLGLHYIRTQSLLGDMRIMLLTGVAVVNRAWALRSIERALEGTDADPQVVEVSRRAAPLAPALPPGVTAETWERHLDYGEGP
jgi:lipopolysaccharide/colanic/teichoic acid biosynthesis glycosyltransferase